MVILIVINSYIIIKYSYNDIDEENNALNKNNKNIKKIRVYVNDHS